MGTHKQPQIPSMRDGREQFNWSNVTQMQDQQSLWPRLNPANALSQPARNLLNLEAVQLFACPCCNLAFIEKHMLRNHILTHLEQQFLQANVDVEEKLERNNSTQRELSNSDGNELYVCRFCDLTFTQASDLQDHVRTHSSQPVEDVGMKIQLNDTTHLQFITEDEDDVEGHADEHAENRHDINDVTPPSIDNSAEIQVISSDEDDYQCNICDEKFTQQTAFKLHMLIHRIGKPFQCHFCNYEHRNLKLLKQHMLAHNTENLFHCDFCSYSSSYVQNVRQHMSNHFGEKPFNCKFCGYRSSKKAAVKRHLSQIHPAETTFSNSAKVAQNITPLATHSTKKRLSCNYCSYSSDSERNVRRHLLNHTGQKPFYCRLCGFRSTRKGAVKLHTSRMHPDQNLGKNMKVAQSSAPLATQATKRHFCNVCNYSSNHTRNLRRHMVIHTGEKQFNCRLCGFRSAQKCVVKRHMLRMHPDDTLLSNSAKVAQNSATLTTSGEPTLSSMYPDCGNIARVTPNSDTLTTSEKLPLSRMYPDFQHCSKVNQSSSTLTTSVEPTLLSMYLDLGKCAQVTQNSVTLTTSAEPALSRMHPDFGSSANVIQNSRVYPGFGNSAKPANTKSEVFLCNLCNYKCIRDRRLLHQHMLTHAAKKRFTCKLCSYTSNYKQNLDRHMVTHTDDRPFFCNYCGGTFRQRSTLKRHMSRHTGHSCKFCHFKFNLKSTLETHLSTEHSHEITSGFVNHTEEKSSIDHADPIKIGTVEYDNFKAAEEPILGYNIEFVKVLKEDPCLSGDSFNPIEEQHYFKSVEEHTEGSPFLENRFKPLEVHVQENRFGGANIEPTEDPLSLDNNLKPMKEKERLYSCHICNGKFVLERSLHRHMVTHTNVKLYSCKICNHKFRYKHRDSLTRHMYKHRGENPFHCKLCPSKFTRRKYLLMHVSTEHKHVKKVNPN